MSQTTARKQLGLINYDHIPSGYTYIGRLPNALSTEKFERIEDFFVGDGCLIDRQERRKDGLQVGKPNQFEMPLAGVKWVINAIELGFERPPSAGGLEKETLHHDTRIQEERLRLMYGVSVGGEGVGGYTVVNTSRSSYILPRYSQELSFTVDIWQQVGRQFFKDLLQRIQAGEFGAVS